MAMKKVFCFIFICFQLCILFTSCGGQQEKNLESEQTIGYAQEVGPPLQLSDGTYYPVKYFNYGHSNIFEFYDNIDKFPPLPDDFRLTEEAVLDVAIAIIKNTGNGKYHFVEPTRYDIVYNEELDTYYVYIFPLKPTLDGGMNLMIRSNGEVLAYWHDG